MTSSLVGNLAISTSLQAKRILITGARSPCALELARQLNQCGHVVFAADTTTFHLSRFSNAVKKFLTIPSPRYQVEAFIEKLSELIVSEEIDLLIPMWEEAMYLSLYLDRLPKTCEVFCASFKLIHELHHKWYFIKLLEKLEIKKIPRSVLLRNNHDLEDFSFETPYVLKKCFSRQSRGILKVTTPKPPKITISPDNPWIAQEYIHGEKYCSYSVCYKGEVLAHTAYPVQYTMDGSSCLAFEAIEHPQIMEWVKNIVQKTGYTGQIAFDFIETPSEELYSIECNPRATSGIHLFKSEDRLDRAFLHEISEIITPKVGNTQQIIAAMLLYGLGLGIAEKNFQGYLRKLLTTKDVVFSSRDLKPFLLKPLVLTSYWVRSKKLGMSIPFLFTHDLDWDEDPT